MDRIRFDLPLWMIEIIHRNPKTDKVWLRAVNASTETEAVRTAIALFVGDGLNEILIDKILVSPLVNEEGGENG